jgi:hypothetical protein
MAFNRYDMKHPRSSFTDLIFKNILPSNRHVWGFPQNKCNLILLFKHCIQHTWKQGLYILSWSFYSSCYYQISYICTFSSSEIFSVSLLIQALSDLYLGHFLQIATSIKIIWIWHILPSYLFVIKRKCVLGAKFLGLLTDCSFPITMYYKQILSNLIQNYKQENNKNKHIVHIIHNILFTF